ncbi:MAG: ATP-binding protein [Clostridiales bacterium]|jgi:AAA15 family ATPase/GTPase|nr:ATP-binding protein [Clostridiales bacterium]
MSKKRNGGMNTVLKEFSFSNCYSYKDDATFSMEATRALKDNFDFVFSCGNGEDAVYLNPVAAIYGSNGGGKTNLLRALNDAVSNIYIGLGLRNTPFALNKSHQNIFSHRLVIIKDNNEYEYKYKASSRKVYEESLFERDIVKKGIKKAVFVRENETITDSMFSKDNLQRGFLDAISNNKGILVMKTFGEIGFPPFKPLYDWCGSVVSDMNILNEMERQENLDSFAEQIHKSSLKKANFSKFMQSFDKSLEKVVIGYDNNAYSNNENSKNEPKAHFFLAHNNDEGKQVAFPIEWESNGTQKLMDLYPSITKALENGTPFVCDELDTCFHPLVFKKIVSLFNDREINKKGAQLIFTAHDTVVMNRENLRRDEIHLIDKTEKGASFAYRLSDIVDNDGKKIRMDARYDRLYLDGMLGSSPDGFREAEI